LIGKGKDNPRTDREDPEDRVKYISTRSLTSELEGGGWSTPLPGRINPERHTVPIL